MAVATLAVGSVTLVLSVVLAGIYTMRAGDDRSLARASDTAEDQPDIEISILRTTDDSDAGGSGTVDSDADESSSGGSGSDGSGSNGSDNDGSSPNGSGANESGTDDSNSDATPGGPDVGVGSGDSADGDNPRPGGVPTGQSTPGPDATGPDTPRPSTSNRPTTNGPTSGRPTTDDSTADGSASDRPRPGQSSPRQPATTSPSTRPSTGSSTSDTPSRDQPSTGRTDPAPTADPDTVPPLTNGGGGASTPSTAPSAPSEPNPPASAPAPVSDLGSHQNPAMLGTTIEMSLAGTVMYEVTLGSSDLNADDVIAAANPSNAPPPPGFHYAIVPMTVTYRGPEKGTPWVDISVEFVSSAGSVHKVSDTHAVPPAPTVMDMPVLAPNETAVGNVLVTVPSNDGETWFDTRSAGGVWAVSTPFSASTFYFAAR